MILYPVPYTLYRSSEPKCLELLAVLAQGFGLQRFLLRLAVLLYQGSLRSALPLDLDSEARAMAARDDIAKALEGATAEQKAAILQIL